MPRSVNLVFQGGGVKGMVYVGALKTLPRGVRIRGVAGTSAGSIAAALLASGRTVSEIESIFRRLDAAALLGSSGPRELARLKAVWPQIQEALALLKDVNAWNMIGTGLKLKRAYKDVAPWLERLQDRQGLFSTDGLRQWLVDIFGANTSFEDLNANPQHPGLQIVAATVASCSIPVFFEPILRAADHAGFGGYECEVPRDLDVRYELTLDPPGAA